MPSPKSLANLGLPRILWPLALCAAGLGCHRPLSSSQVSELQAAAREQQQATQPGEWLRVAAQWQAVRENGVRWPTVLMSQGNSYSRGQEYGRAIACYRQALRMNPRDARIRHNLRVCLAVAQIERDPAAGWANALRAWLSLEERWWLVALGASILSVAGSAWVLGGGRGSRSWSAMGLATVAAAVMALATSAVVEQLEVRQQAAAALIRPSQLLSGPAAGFAPIEASDLRDGDEVRVLARQGEWRKARTAAGREGWLAQADLQSY